MPSTAMNLHVMAAFVNLYVVHTGDQFATSERDLDICGIAYVVCEDQPVPAQFYTDEDASLRLIECSAPAMDAIRALSAALDTPPCTTEIAPGHEAPDYLEHVSNWARTPGIGEQQPPSTSEVIGCILRAVALLDGIDYVPHQRAA